MDHHIKVTISKSKKVLIFLVLFNTILIGIYFVNINSIKYSIKDLLISDSLFGNFSIQLNFIYDLNATAGNSSVKDKTNTTKFSTYEITVTKVLAKRDELEMCTYYVDTTNKTSIN